MNNKEISEAIKKAKELSKGRKFKQTFDFIVTLKNLDFKKPEQQVDFFTNLHFPVKKRSICAIVGGELLEQAKETCDEVITQEDFPKFQKDKKLMKNLANKHDFFVAQASIMPQVAQTFGKVFGPKGKMPNPKAGCVVPPNANMKQVYERLQLTVSVKAKSHLMIQVSVGKEEQDEKEVAENIYAIYDQIIHHLPLEKNNVKSVLLKLTMGKPVEVGKADEAVAEPVKKGKKETSEKQKETAEKEEKQEKPEENNEEAEKTEEEKDSAEDKKE